MRKLSCILITLVFSFMVSCESGIQEPDVEKKDNPFTITEAKNAEKRQVTDWIKRYDKQSSKAFFAESKSQFDFSKMKRVEKKGSDDMHTLAVPVRSQGKVKQVIGFYKHKGRIVSALQVRTKRLSATVAEITYFDVDGTKLLTVKADKAKGQAKVLYSRSGHTSHKVQGSALADCTGGEVVACVESWYMDYGWFSLALTVASAFDPYILLAVAIECAIYECLINNSTYSLNDKPFSVWITTPVKA